ncbi:tRNA selenocysteine 1-associated protein 1-like isoform X2 [Mixophyes fleayi]|uniref:tRNA selenocysteine 1-associated protein 1-like isoform X2 n=1 Tax=Mixophyes fleayi TaxID=3061075 RepID=UPI003F4D7854
MASLWMGDVSENMTESMIMEAFQAMGETPVRARIKRNRFTGVLSGYSFVEFPDYATASKCLQKLNGELIPNAIPPGRFKLRHSLYANPPDPSVPPTLTNDPGSAHSADAATVAQPPPARNPAIEYMQSFIYYPQQFQHTLPNWKYDQKSNSYSFQQYGYTADKWQVPEGFKEEAFEDPNPSVDVNEANKEFLQQSEELYDALLCSHWQMLNIGTTKIPTG